jgi:hypothetical protein
MLFVNWIIAAPDVIRAAMALRHFDQSGRTDGIRISVKARHGLFFCRKVSRWIALMHTFAKKSCQVATDKSSLLQAYAK